MKVTIFIALKYFAPEQLDNSGLVGLSQMRLDTKVYSGEHYLEKKHEALTKTSSLVSIALPKEQSNYTVLRSPHIDKKSRDQFVLKVHKRLIIVKTEIRELRKKLFNLKFHEIPGVQMKVIFQTKTRLNSSCF
jgi:ribosomal protein S10